MAETTFQWGQWDNNALLNATPTAPTSWSPTLPITAIEGGNDHCMALDSAGVVWCWGNNDVGQFGSGTSGATAVTTPVKTLLPPGVVITAIGEAFASSYAIDTTGALWYWGGAPRLGISTVIPMKLISGQTWAQVAGGSQHVLLLTTAGALYAWGENQWGELGTGTTTCNYYPVLIPSSTFSSRTLSSISAGDFHSGAIDSTGVIWMWGLNTFGQCANGTFGPTQSTPTVVTPSAGKTCLQLTCGGSRLLTNGHTMCILSDNTVWAWGANGSSQLGIGGTTNQNTPQQLLTSGSFPLPTSTIKSIYAGGDQSMLIDSANNCWMVGDNTNGQSGNGGTAGTPATTTTWLKPTGVSSNVNLISSTADDMMCHQTA